MLRNKSVQLNGETVMILNAFPVTIAESVILVGLVIIIVLLVRKK